MSLSIWEMFRRPANLVGSNTDNPLHINWEPMDPALRGYFRLSGTPRFFAEFRQAVHGGSEAPPLRLLSSCPAVLSAFIRCARPSLADLVR